MVDDIDMGEPVLHDVDGWLAQRRKVDRGTMRCNVIIMLAFWSLGLLSLLFLDPDLVLVAFIIVPMVCVPVDFLQKRSFDWWDRRNGDVDGLYERGLFFRIFGRTRWFIPYAVIERIETKKGRFSTNTLLHLRGHEEPFYTGDLDILLGEYGMAYMMRTIEGRVQHVGPPELRIYGPGGAHAQRPKRERVHDDAAGYGITPPFQD